MCVRNIFIIFSLSILLFSSCSQKNNNGMQSASEFNKMPILKEAESRISMMKDGRQILNLLNGYIVNDSDNVFLHRLYQDKAREMGVDPILRYRSYLDSNPRSPLYLYLLARLIDETEADSLITTALSIDNEYYWALIEKGYLLGYMPDEDLYKESLKNFRKAFTIDNTVGEGYFLLYFAAKVNSDFEMAMWAIEQSIATQPRHSGYRREACAFAYSQSRWDFFDKKVRNWLRDEPDDIFYLPYLSRACKEQGKIDEAIEFKKSQLKYSQALSRPDVMIELAALHLEKNDTELCLNYIEQASDNNFRNAAMLLNTEPFTQLADNERFQSLIKSMERLQGVGNSAFELKGTTLDGQDFDLAEHKGKVVLVDFWATWCSPCMDSLPEIVNLYEKYHDQGFEIIGISHDNDENALRGVLAEYNIKWQQLADFTTKRNPWAELWKVRFIPTTFLIDKNGKIQAVNYQGKILEDKILSLLNQN